MWGNGKEGIPFLRVMVAVVCGSLFVNRWIDESEMMVGAELGYIRTRKLSVGPRHGGAVHMPSRTCDLIVCAEFPGHFAEYKLNDRSQKM